MSNNIEETLSERAKTHGSFTDNARLSQQFKQLMRTSPNWSLLDSVKREALEMIQHKIARALSGNFNERDHWIDLAGYAQLVVTDFSVAPAHHAEEAPMPPPILDVIDAREADTPEDMGLKAGEALVAHE